MSKNHADLETLVREAPRDEEPDCEGHRDWWAGERRMGPAAPHDVELAADALRRVAQQQRHIDVGGSWLRHAKTRCPLVAMPVACRSPLVLHVASSSSKYTMGPRSSTTTASH